MLRLLCFTAHPDDETVGFGGSLLKYRRQGVDTFVVCLTAGQAATHRGGAGTDADLASLRRQELAASCAILDVTQHEVLAYPDGALDALPFLDVVEALTKRVRAIRPHVVMTFGAEGGPTAHRDHAMTSIFATAAFHWAGRDDRFTDHMDAGLAPHRAQKLYYATTTVAPRGWHPVAQGPYGASIDVSDVVDRKLAALHAHASQAPAFPFVDRTIRRHGAIEHFHLAASIRPAPVSAETDLFTGVMEEG